MTGTLARAVRRRAGDRCEYCRLPSAAHPLSFHIDHIRARQHGGVTAEDNLAFACMHCNRHKGPNIAGRDPVTGDVALLYNPRTERWADHFIWHGAELRGLSATGRATVLVLAINKPDHLALREALLAEGGSIANASATIKR